MLATFGPGSGTLGRAPDCTLVLPDEARHISRQQARIEVVGNRSSITCLSAANPLIINGQELRQGQVRPLVNGDRIDVAGYELRFEDGSGHAEPGAAMALIPDDPFADPSIPDAFDPFSAPAAAPLNPAASASPEGSDPLGLGLGMPADQRMADLPAGRGDSIDALFDLGPGLDPLAAGSPLGQPAGEPVRNAQQRAAHEAAQRLADPVADHASVLSGSFRLPQEIPPTEFGLPEDPVLSWKESDAAQEAILPPAPGGNVDEIKALAEQYFESPPVPARDSEPPAGTTLDTHPPAAASRFDPAEFPADASPPGDARMLRQALLEGLGLAELPRAAGDRGAVEPLTPELMRRLGELVATACEGTVELLQARATLKQELRADVTMIGPRDNNPLKFAPDGETALVQLLAAQAVRGFMAPRRAMRDAYDDLLAHQIGFVAGMRAAMQGLIERFDPKVLEGRLAGKPVLDAMLPAARKARLWELFDSLYAEVSREAEDDFERLFGRAFVKAYEEQIARIEAGTQRRERGEAARR
jgi:type VI secretion system FHA domain protein